MPTLRSPLAPVLTAALAGAALTGCSPGLEFGHEPSAETIASARAMAAPEEGPIAIRWTPGTFPERVDQVAPSGMEGERSTADIPTGAAISGRLEGILDEMIGHDPAASRDVRITVIDARTEYQYATFEREIDIARCVVEVEMALGGTPWTDMFVAETREITTGLRGPALVEAAWDEVTLRMARSIVDHARAEAMAIADDPAGDMTTLTPGADADEGLRRLIQSWPNLPEPVRQRILGILEGAALWDRD
jgi:hypothetical protein